jgi:Malectin domain
MQYHTRVNARKFDVYVEGVLVVDNLDIYAMAPGGNIPYVVTFSTFVTDGAITIDLVRNIDNPQLNGIEVFDDGAPIPAPTTAPRALPPNSAPVPSGGTFKDIVINCGGLLTNDFMIKLSFPSMPNSVVLLPFPKFRSFVLGTIRLATMERR